MHGYFEKCASGRVRVSGGEGAHLTLWHLLRQLECDVYAFWLWTAPGDEIILSRRNMQFMNSVAAGMPITMEKCRTSPD